MKYTGSIPNNKTKGFTLIEVLVASVILFASIATVSVIYRGAFISSEKANKNINISAVIPSLLANIRDDIQAQANTSDTQLNQNGNVWAIQYQWQATLISHKSAPNKLDVDSGEYITPPLKYKLWLVNLNLEKDKANKQYQFYQMSWSDD